MKFIDNQLKAKIVKLEDANNNFVNDNVEDALNEAGNKIKNKQDKLVSGTNIKTINGASILGSGNIEITGEGGSIDTSSFATKTDLAKKQNLLVFFKALYVDWREIIKSLGIAKYSRDSSTVNCSSFFLYIKVGSY